MTTDATATRHGTGSLAKALRLLTEIGSAGPDALRLTELVSRTEIEPSTAFRMLACLVAEDFLEKVDGKRYRFGRCVYELGLVAEQHFRYYEAAGPELLRLAARIGTPVRVELRSGGETVHVGGDAEAIPIGARHLIGITSGGVALLAAMAPEEADTLLRANERRYRQRGHGFARDLRQRVQRARLDGIFLRCARASGRPRRFRDGRAERQPLSRWWPSAPSAARRRSIPASCWRCARRRRTWHGRSIRSAAKATLPQFGKKIGLPGGVPPPEFHQRAHERGPTLAKRQFHLAWFLSQGYGPKTWRGAWPGSDSDVKRWMMPDLFLDLARGMDRACFDYMIIEDSSMVPYTYKGSHDTYLKYAASSPKLDPAVLVPHLALATKHLGLVPTLSTSEYPPFLLARLVNSLDHTTEGRVGWNCVTSSNDGAAQNYGNEGQFPHDERYDRADEFSDLVTRLWEAWEPDAVVLDRETPMFADGSKVRAVNFEGKYFKCRGPLNAPRGPQGRVPICQAGGSPRGQEFAAHWANTVITDAGSMEGMKSYRQDLRRRAVTAGRKPDDIKVLFLAYPIVDVSMEAAQDRRRLQREETGAHLDMALSSMSRLTNIDFAQFPLDEPLPADLTTNGHQSSLAKWIGKTPREVALSQTTKMGIDFTGTVDHVAGMMAEIMEEVGGDGFLIFNTYFDRRYISEVCDGLVPELQRRGLTRKAYAHKHFKDNLLEF